MTVAINQSAGADPANAASVFGIAADENRLVRTCEALRSRGFEAELLEDARGARDRVLELIPRGSSVLTAASETLRLSGLEAAINDCGEYAAIRPRVRTLSRTTHPDDLRMLMSTPDVVVGSAVAVTETGSVVVVSASGSQLPSYAGGAGAAILIIGAQKVVPTLDRAFERAERYALPLETERALKAYGRPSAINSLLVLHREPVGARTRVLLLREVIGY
jgi:hypothetical protein